MSLKTINDLTAVDESQLQNYALIEGAIPPVSGSIFTPVKVTLAKLAKWILNSYTGLSLAGSSQSVKAAVDGLNGKLTNQFTMRSYDAGTQSVSANSSLGLSANDFSASTPSGYTPIAIVYYSTGIASCSVYSISAIATGTGRMMSIYNNSGSAVNAKPAITILYAKE